MDDIEVTTPEGSVELCGVGQEDGGVVLYFHSPATSGEELADAASAAAKLDLRVLCVKRPSIECPEAHRFVDATADQIHMIATAMALQDLALLAWSGGAAYALAAATRLGATVSSVHLVSPVPGPLTGPDAIEDQTERLRQVSRSTASSGWVSGSASLRDYQAVSAPWSFDIGNIRQPVTVWSPIDDEIVPPRLINHLTHGLPNAETISVPGGHDWLVQNWGSVLERVR